MSRARIINGKWSRNVTWEKDGIWRTDMFKTVLKDYRLKEAEFICKEGPIITIPVEDLRRVLPLGGEHYTDGKIWGPFNIDPVASTVDGHPVAMRVISN